MTTAPKPGDGDLFDADHGVRRLPERRHWRPPWGLAGLVALGLTLVPAACALFLAGPANAQEVLEENIDRARVESEQRLTLLRAFKLGDDEHYVRFSGSINKGVLIHNDGVQNLDYWFVDNSNLSTRARLEGYAAVGENMATGGKLEAEWTPYATTNVNQLNRGDYDWDSALLRHADFWIGDSEDGNRYGRLSIGQGFMASDTTTEIDLSETWVAGYAGVGDASGGQFFRTKGTGALSTVRVSDTFGNLDGLSRLLRVRYRSPKIAGFRISTSYGTKVIPNATGKPGWDAALRYSHKQNGTEFASALAYSVAGDGTQLVSGSASLLLPSNVNFTVAAANTLTGAVNSRYVYGKVGYIAHLIEAGQTAFSIDGYFGKDFNTAGSRSTAYGLQIVQQLDYWKSQIYVGVRKYEFSEMKTGYKDAYGILAGIKILY